MTVAEQDSGGHLLHVLHPGGVACGERGERFETLLGSCVAIVLTDPRRTVGAMCHIVHAMPAPAGRHDDATYADAALRQMNQRLRARGLQPGQCEAYVYGGATCSQSPQHVGAQCRWALGAAARASRAPTLAATLTGDCAGPWAAMRRRSPPCRSEEHE
ncbi:MAG: chemotaxis protein CheD [Piscinibacter sp.]|nr:chemotaxis protein CheD [Piscinibacter sp.]